MISYSIIGVLWVACAWLWLRKLRRQHPSPGLLRPAAATLAIIVGSCGLAALWGGWLSPAAITDNGRMRLDYARGYKAGQQIETKTTALLFCAADEADTLRIRNIRDGLTAGGIKEVILSGIEPGKKLPPGSDEVSDSCRLTAKDFDRVIQEARDDAAWVFAVELPRDFGRMRLWKKSAPAPVYWLESNDPAALRQALASGRIRGFCALRSGAALDQTIISSDPETAFQSRYEWIQ